MKITCQSCDAKYSIADEKVQGKVAKIRCKKCGATIVVGGADAGSAPSAAAAESAGGSIYTVNISDSDQRSMSLAEVIEAYNNGTVNGETYVWAEGMDDWLPLASVPEITAALGGGGEAAAPEPAPAPAAARRDAGRSKVDLFGGAAQAGSEEEVVRQSALPAPTPSYGGGGGGGGSLTGARSEQSVLFSLSALANTASAPSSASSANKKTTEDSGLIDLSALARAAAEQPAAAAPAALPLTPMLGAPVLGAPVLEAPAVTAAAAAAAAPEAAKGNKSGALIAGALVLGCIVIAAALFFSRKDPANDVTAVQPTATTTATATATATATEAAATAAPTSTAVDPTAAAATATATATTTATAAPVATAKPVANTKKTTADTKPATAATTKPAAAATAKPAASKCGCAPSDLMCNMKCAAGKLALVFKRSPPCSARLFGARARGRCFLLPAYQGTLSEHQTQAPRP